MSSDEINDLNYEAGSEEYSNEVIEASPEEAEVPKQEEPTETLPINKQKAS